MEVHFVHMNSHGELGVLGVMIEEGGENDTLAAILATDPTDVGKHVLHQGGNINPNKLVPSHKDEIEEYFIFTGSLTTPPCSEGVNWLIAKHPVQASEEQIEVFTEIFTHHGQYPGNNRPVQAANYRVIKESKD